MTITYINFRPSTLAPFQFQVTLDGQAYQCICTWNFQAQRFYVNIYTLTKKLFLCIPQIGSPDGYDISLTAGYTVTKLVYRAANQQFEVINL